MPKSVQHPDFANQAVIMPTDASKKPPGAGQQAKIGGGATESNSACSICKNKFLDAVKENVVCIEGVKFHKLCLACTDCKSTPPVSLFSSSMKFSL